MSQKIKLSKFDLGWVVGLIEADGSFNHNGKVPIVAVKMTDLDTVTRFATLVKVRVTGPYSYEYKDGHSRKPQYAARITGAEARSWMTYLKPYMSMRRQKQIEVALGGQAELFEFPRHIM